MDAQRRGCAIVVTIDNAKAAAALPAMSTR
jgi:hypothetical protein